MKARLSEDSERMGTTKAQRPRVVCHMMVSIDGRIVADGWPLGQEGRREYESVHVAYDAQGWLCGRVTMQEHFAAGARSDAEVAQVHSGPTREDHIAPGEHSSFAIAVDPSGRLLWQSGNAGGDHVVALLTERVSDEYLAMLRETGVSYLLAGRDDLDLALALEKLRQRLDVATLMLEGGGAINGSFLSAGLIDEVSLLVAPVVDGRVGTAALFDVADANFAARRLDLDAVDRRADGLLWLRYRLATQG